MRRVYTSTAHFRAPYDTPNVSFAGLGAGHAEYDANKWPAGRSYWSPHFYRAPYQAGYYQSGALRGLGAAAPSSALVVPSASGLPPSIQRYAVSGQPPSPILRDLGTVSNQIPRWGYAALALGAGWLAYKAWKQAEQEKARKAAA